jgi:hypothetical protein
MISEADFVALPRTDVVRFTPQTIIYAAAGTRRQAALAGIDAGGEEYPRWSRLQMLAACQLLFDHGVRHIFTLLAGPGQFQEVGNYGERLLAWLAWGVAGEEALADFRRLGWRVRLLCGDDLPQLHAARTQLERLGGDAARTLWLQVVSHVDAPWQWVLEAANRSQARTRQAAVRALYGEDVPLASLYLAFGKPVVAPELIPPLLAGAVQCYWTQRPGYSLTELELRRILYDYAFTRATWRADKTGRAEQVLEHAEAWRRGPLLGIGTRLGPFWYPEPFVMPAECRDGSGVVGRAEAEGL